MNEKPWHVCDDCLVPLASELIALADRFGVHFDVAACDLLDERQRIQERAGFNESRLPAKQRARLRKIQNLLADKPKPPCLAEVYPLYQRLKIDEAVTWLKINCSVEFAEEFHQTLDDAHKRFAALHFQARRLLKAAGGKRAADSVRYAILRIVAEHNARLPTKPANDEYRVTLVELPDDYPDSELWVVHEYAACGQGFRDAAAFLRHVAEMVRPKLSHSPKESEGERAEYEKRQRESAIVDRWNKAHKARVYKVTFAKQIGMTLKEFDRLLARVRMYNHRANEPRERRKKMFAQKTSSRFLR